MVVGSGQVVAFGVSDGQHAHTDLVAGNHSTTTVGQVARYWGFGNLGRFAVLYRQTYGRSPHVTPRD